MVAAFEPFISIKGVGCTARVVMPFVTITNVDTRTVLLDLENAMLNGALVKDAGMLPAVTGITNMDGA